MPAALPIPRPHHDGHRNVQGGQARAAVFGISDGLVSNVALVLGVAGAGVDGSVVRLGGLAGLVAGAVSMAAGEYVSMRAQRELLEHELHIERRELERNPEYEQRELANRYRARGVRADTATEMAAAVMEDLDLALEVHAREELGIDPAVLGSPVGAAAFSFTAFAVGAAVPVIPWFLASGAVAMTVSLLLAVALAMAVGAIVGHLSGRSPLRGAIRQATIALVSCAVTYAIGRVVGVNVAS